MFRGTFSLFCGRSCYVADDDDVRLMMGSFRHHRPHNHQSDESHSSRVSSDCQTGRARGPTEEPGGSVFRSASIFALVSISMYWLVVVMLTCPSHDLMTLSSTPVLKQVHSRGYL